uniref:EGF-like domain-containing protein n=1 Tax=Sparus aurata TaxID=8175 RepID=A0A671WI35_SPAAU
MSSPGLLLLLLVSSSLLLSNVSTSADEIKVFEMTPEETNKHLKRVKTVVKLFRDNADKIRFALVPFLNMIPVAGSEVGAVVNLILLGVSATNKNEVLGTIVSEFKDLNIKLDNYRIEQKWDTWASSAFHKPEKKIREGWDSYITLLSALEQAKDEAERERHRKKFFDAYRVNKYESATKDLRTYLQAKGRTLISNLGDLFAEKVRCHEKDIKEFTVFINELIMKGSFLNDLYYEYENNNSSAIDAEAAKINYDAGSAMFQVHKSCIFNSMEYVKLDVTDLMNDPKDHKDRQKLAEKVRSFLSQTYNRYDWMVVAYLTKHSNRTFLKTENRHYLSNFTEVTKGEVSVVVARQMTGNYTMVKDLKTELDRCFTKSVLCSDVEKKLKGCVKVSGSYTAVHAYTDKGHASYTEPSTTKAPYIYTRKCKKIKLVKGGQIVIMIKSDEEMNKNPCDNLKCNGGKNEGTDRGECVHPEDTFVAMCECKHPYYGQQCELSLDDYKKELQKFKDELNMIYRI